MPRRSPTPPHGPPRARSHRSTSRPTSSNRRRSHDERRRVHPSPGRCLTLGYDRSESSRRAAHWAVRELAPDGKLVIVHAERSLHAPQSPLVSSHERGELGRAIVDELLLTGEDRLRDLDLAVEILDEDPVAALIDATERHHAEAIVIGTKSHSRLHRAVGLVSDELLSRSPVPVIVVPPGVGDPASYRAAAR